MHPLFLITCLLAQAPAASPADTPRDETARIERLRDEYAADARKYQLFRDAAHRQPLAISDQPVMRWFNDNDWSGDLFVWSHDGLPEAIGCMLSGPSGAQRKVFHEFHLLAEMPIAPVDLYSGRKWAPKEGLARQALPDAPKPAASPAARLSQMRRILRDCSAHMEADGVWELRLLPQPIHRYSSEKAGVVDGALFCYVWTRGTDPELLVLLECRQGHDGQLAWHWTPVRFSTRAVWIVRDEKEIWRSESHREPGSQTTTLPYTTSYAHMLSLPNTPSPGETPSLTPAKPDEKIELRPQLLPE